MTSTEIMAYDIWGSWSAGVGPNAPLYDKCAAKQAGSVETAVDNWASANFPKNQVSKTSSIRLLHSIDSRVRSLSECHLTVVVSACHPAKATILAASPPSTSRRPLQEMRTRPLLVRNCINRQIKFTYAHLRCSLIGQFWPLRLFGFDYTRLSDRYR